MVFIKPAAIKPAKYILVELMKYVSGGNDSEVRTELTRMDKKEVDYILQLVRRLEAIITTHQRGNRKRL